MATTSELIIDRLLEWGVDTYFGLPGDGINNFFEALRRRRDDVRFVHSRHEEEAALAAVGYAKFTGRPAVVVSTSGPGAVHVLNGLYDSAVEGAPLIAITGLQFHDMLGTHYLQDINHHYAFDNACVFNQQVNGPAHAVGMTDLAYRTAMARRGPVHLAIPIDVQAWELDDLPRSNKNLPGHTSTVLAHQRADASPQDLEAAAETLARCSKVVIVAGAGARGAHAELEAVADKLAAPIVKPALGKDALGDDSPFVLGGTGFAGTSPGQWALAECDGILIVGSSSGYFDFWAQPGQARGVQIDLDAARIGLRYPVEVAVVADARSALDGLAHRLDRRTDRSFLEAAQSHLRDWWQLVEKQSASIDMPMKPQVVTAHLAEQLTDDAIVCGDAGTVTVWQGRLRMRTGQRFSFSGTNCSMAAAIPYAIGAKTAYPDRQVVAIQGDGSAAMLMGSLATLAQHHLDVTVVVMNNASLGLIVWEQMAYLGNPEHECDLSRVDFAKVAEGCGLRGFHLEDPADAAEVIAQAVAHPGPALVDCWVDVDESPFAETLKPAQAQHIVTALERGEPGAQRKAARLTAPDLLAQSPGLRDVADRLRTLDSEA